MPFDEDIKKIFETCIECDLSAPKVPRERIPKLKRVWKCDNAHDFLYGHRTGYYKGLVEGMVLERYGRQLTEEEDNEVFRILEPYTRALRKYFLYYKEQRTVRRTPNKK